MKVCSSAGVLPLLMAAAVCLPSACRNGGEDSQSPRAQENAAANLTPDQALIYHAAHANAGGVAQALDNGANIEATDENGLTALMWAAQQNTAAVVGLLLQRGANPYHADDAGWTALHSAASSGNLDGMKALLAAAPGSIETANDKGETPLLLAIGMHREECAHALLDAGANVHAGNHGGQNALDVAIEEKLHDLVQDLRRLGAYPNETILLLDIARDGRTDSLKRYLQNHPEAELDVHNANGMTPLLIASAAGHIGTMKVLLDAGANVAVHDNVGMTPLLFAALEGRLEAVKLLLDHGASLGESTKGGWTPMLLAAGHRHTNVVRFVLEHGGNVNEVNQEGVTALLVAATCGHAEMAELLIAHGASMEMKDSYGWTPLMVAAAYGHSRVVEILLNAGADMTQADGNGWTAAHCAASAGSPTTLILLKSHGADLLCKTALKSSPLHIAAGLGQLDAVRYLLEECKSPVNAKDESGWTPLMHAAALGQPDVVEFLLNAGADPDVKSVLGETARHLAAVRGQDAVLRVMENAGVTK